MRSISNTCYSPAAPPPPTPPRSGGGGGGGGGTSAQGASISDKVGVANTRHTLMVRFFHDLFADARAVHRRAGRTRQARGEAKGGTFMMRMCNCVGIVV